jgi:hypothetical protein
MYNQNQHLAHNAQSALENHRREQEERKQAMIREQKLHELKDLETQLFYKKQEVDRLTALYNRLYRESTLRRNTEIKEKNEAQSQERLLKETESKIKNLEQDVQRTLLDISEKISKEKAILLEHKSNLESLEKQKREIESKKETGKRTLSESLSRILFIKKKEEKESQHAADLAHTNQVQIQHISESLKLFNQQVTVLENKIRSLRTSFR